jgi:hypothetical protein
MGSKSSERKHLHTTVSPEVYTVIENLSAEYGTKQNVIEAAINLLRVRAHRTHDLNKSDLDSYQLWHLMRSDFNMMAVARRTFLSYIDSIPTEPINNNNALELIEWYYNRTRITELNLYQILNGIKILWKAGNYFREIEIEILDGKDPLQSESFKLIFTHDFDSPNYGKYWAKYFQAVLKSPEIKAQVEVFDRFQSFYLLVTT